MLYGTCYEIRQWRSGIRIDSRGGARVYDYHGVKDITSLRQFADC